MDRRFRRILLVLVLFGILVWVYGFIPEIATAFSHLTRGNQRSINGYVVPVPLAWFSSGDVSGMSMSTESGWVRSFINGRSYALIEVFPDKRSVTGAEYLNQLEARLTGGIKSLSERNVGGVPNTCLTYASTDYSAVDIYCFPKEKGSIMASYAGDSRHIPEFFAILDGVKKAK